MPVTLEGGGLITKMNSDHPADVEFDRMRQHQYRNDLQAQIDLNKSMPKRLKVLSEEERGETH